MKIKYTVLLALLFCNAIGFAQKNKIGDEYVKSNTIINQGIELFDSSKYSDAIIEFNKIHEGDSLYWLAQYEKCLALNAIDSFNTTLSIIDKIIDIKSYEYKSESYLLKINAFIGLEKYTEALECIKKAQNIFPYQNMFLIREADVYSLQKNYNDAYLTLERSIKLNPYYSSTHLGLARFYSKMGIPSLSILAYQMYILTNNSESLIDKALGELETVCKNQQKVLSEYNEAYLTKFKDFEEIDQVINSQAAISNKYKSKIKLTFISNKQLQYVLERLPDIKSQNSIAADFYIDFYRKVWENNYFEGCVLSGFRTVNIDVVKSEYTKKKKKVSQFEDWGNEYLSNLRGYKKIMVDGKEEEYFFIYDQGKLYGYGKLDENKLKTGPWIFYFKNGALEAKGEYLANKLIGTWYYYFDDGSLRKILDINDKEEKHGRYWTYNNNGQKIEDYTYKNNLVDGTIKVYRDNGSLQFSGNFKDGELVGPRNYYSKYSKLVEVQPMLNDKINGVMKDYYNSGALESEITYKDDMRNGLAKYYHENGKISSSGNFVNDNYDGKWNIYYESGKINIEKTYSNKNLESEVYYFENGNKETNYPYKNGILEGKSLSYDEKGRLLSEFNYKKDKIVDYKYYDTLKNVIHSAAMKNNAIKIIRFNEKRIKISESDFVNGLNDGTIKFYYPSGAIQSEFNYKDGIKNGININYYENGNKKYEQYYVDNVTQGYYTSYFEHGIVEGYGFLKDNKQVGEWIFNHPNGTTNSIYFYNNNLMNGPYRVFDIKGKLNTEYWYDHGLLYSVVQFDTTGKIFNKVNAKPGNGEFVMKNYAGNIYKKYSNKYGDLDSLTIFYDNFGKPFETILYEYGQKNKSSEVYSLISNKLRMTGNYKNGKKDGKWTKYNLFGNVSVEESFKDGELSGPRFIYNEEGFVEYKLNYSEDERDGECYVYSSKNDLVAKFFYVDGFLQKYTYLDAKGNFVPYINLKKGKDKIVCYYPNGTKSLEIDIDNNLYSGIYKVYFVDGTVMEEEYYKDDYSNGSSKKYYRNGKLMYDRNLKDDYENGLQQTYHNNGKLYVQYTSILGDLFGDLFVYDVNGKLIKKETYYNDINCNKK